ncbi:unnamed protein product [Miscanthus lutarioriparius]|uniref:DUF4005 domain-containing protein n=1 Tax=Miscanthus lutarioriparius TaxID=422564 RepID=A0A811RA91_9POAL|nr:unnamed protein product [Miscanthus lutarioriparius]
MGKAGRWLRNLFLSGRKGRKAKDRAADADCQSVLSAPLPSQAATATPSGREKRRWSFRRTGAGAGAGASGGAQGQGLLASSSSHCFSEAEVHVVVVAQEQDQQQQVAAAAAVVPEAASSTAGAVVTLPASGRRSAGRDAEAAAAVRIQAAFRSYLARKALCALRGTVRLQAMVRGQLVRRQANLTLRRMQALVHAQRRARAERLLLLEVEDVASSRQQAAAAATPRPPPSRRSPQHPRSRKPQEAAERGSEENDVRIVEVDDDAPRAAPRRNSSYCHYSTSTTTPSRTPAKAELLCQKVSPTPSALTDVSARTLSGRFDDASFTSALEPVPTPVPSRRRAWRADLPSFPSYMANTESSRAKARSQSAPRQRLSSASETAALAAAASPSPSCWERPPCRGGGGGGDGSSARRRASLDPLDLPGGGAPSRCMERCASRARASTMSSVPGSECGSSSTVGHRGSARTGRGHGMGDY